MRFQGSFSTPPVVQNIIILNVLFFMAEMILPARMGDWMFANLGLYFWESGNFHLHQLVTHMFMHANLTHLFMVTGVGAALIQLGVTWLQVDSMSSAAFVDQAKLQSLIYAPMIGASGAVFGVLLAFGMMHPNAILMLLIPPIPIKAKYLVIGYGVLELFLGTTGLQSGVAHFAHLGGMLWGFFLLRYWKKRGDIYY